MLQTLRLRSVKPSAQSMLRGEEFVKERTGLATKLQLFDLVRRMRHLSHRRRDKLD